MQKKNEGPQKSGFDLKKLDIFVDWLESLATTKEIKSVLEKIEKYK